jgi:hypothetical protein
MRARSLFVGARGALVGLGLVACHPPRATASSEPPAEVAPPAAAQVAAPAPSILSAHLARLDDPELGGKDGLVVVFDVEIDALALQPRAFVVTGQTKGPTWPEQAILAPASEDDENRTVLLVGELGDATPAGQPTHVAVAGSLFAEDGRRLQGLGAPVVSFAAPLLVVAAEVLGAAPGRCEGVAQVLRTYWNDELRDVAPDDLSRVRIQAGQAAPVAPLRFDDHTAEHAEAGQDNVLDLCVDDPAPLGRVWIEAGAFRDPSGHASAAVELRVGEPDA